MMINMSPIFCITIWQKVCIIPFHDKEVTGQICWLVLNLNTCYLDSLVAINKFVGETTIVGTRNPFCMEGRF